MLRCSTFNRVVFQNPTMPRVLNHVSPDRLELTLRCLREHKKRMRYLSSHFQRYNERMYWYGVRGSLRKGTRYVVSRHSSRTQFVHPSHGHNNVDIRAIKCAGAQYDQMGNTTRITWDLSMATTNLLNEGSLKRWTRNISKDNAISLLEQWGVRYVLLDEERKPQVVDSKYHRHNIYANKFHYSPDAHINGHVGDVEVKWKELEEIGYPDYGAHTPSPKNHFRTLWRTMPVAPRKIVTPPAAEEGAASA